MGHRLFVVFLFGRTESSITCSSIADPTEGLKQDTPPHLSPVSTVNVIFIFIMNPIPYLLHLTPVYCTGCAKTMSICC